MNFRFGPLVRHWTMRYEAKHSYFKHLAQSMGNFINLPYSLAARHQESQCYINVNKQELLGCANTIDVGPGNCNGYFIIHQGHLSLSQTIQADNRSDIVVMHSHSPPNIYSSIF